VPLATTRAPLCTASVQSVRSFVCLCVCLSVAKILTQKRNFLKNYAVESYGLYWKPLYAVLHELFKQRIEPLKFKKTEIRHLENREIAISQRKIMQFRWNLVHNSIIGTRWEPDGQIWTFSKIQDGGRPPFQNSFFGHNSAADCPISVKFCTGKHKSMAIEVTWHKLYTSKIQGGGRPPYCKSLNRHISINKCIGDDTKATARRNPNCIKNKVMRSMTYLSRRANKFRHHYWQCGTGRCLLCSTVGHRARFTASESGAWSVGQGLLCLLCLTVGHMATFALPESVAWGEVCCVWQFGVGRGLLCLRVRHRARFDVSDSGAQSEVYWAWQRNVGRFAVRDSGAQGEVCCAWQRGVGRFAVRDSGAQGKVCRACEVCFGVAGNQNKIRRRTIFNMADGILLPCSLARGFGMTWHWICPNACHIGILLPVSLDRIIAISRWSGIRFQEE